MYLGKVWRDRQFEQLVGGIMIIQREKCLRQEGRHWYDGKINEELEEKITEFFLKICTILYK